MSLLLETFLPLMVTLGVLFFQRQAQWDALLLVFTLAEGEGVKAGWNLNAHFEIFSLHFLTIEESPNKTISKTISEEQI